MVNSACPVKSLSVETTKKWLVRMKFCQTISWNSDHENEVLPVCFVRTGLWKLKFCQFKLQILYCTTVVLSSRLFRLKLCLWLNSICFVKVLPSSAYRLGWPYKRWAMLLFYRTGHFHTWARVTWNFSTYRSCSACRLHPFVARLDRIQLGSGH